MRHPLLDELVCPRTGGDLRVEVLAQVDGDITSALLHGDAATYPVVAGVPVFLPGAERLVELVRAGRTDHAAALAAYGSLPWSRARTLVGAVGSALPRARALTGRIDVWLERRELDAGGAHLQGTDGRGPDLGSVRHGFLDSRRPNPDGFDYFRYRLGTPRHLVALSLVEQAEAPPGPALDVGCGHGHLTAALGARRPGAGPVFGVDSDFLGLAFAHHRVATDAGLVCADAGSLPFRDASFALVFSSDVLPYVRDKRRAVREMERVATRGAPLVLTALRNRFADHVYGGETLSPDGWVQLVGHLDHRVFGDARALDRYLTRHGPEPLAAAHDAADEQTLSIVASRATVAVDAGPFTDWPHARGVLAVHPLLAPRRTGTDWVEYGQSLPSATYARDHPLLRRYLPEQWTATRALVDEAARAPGPASRSRALEEALARVAVLGQPPRLATDPWPGFTRAGDTHVVGA